MADTQAFEYVCVQLEDRTALDRLAARGTVRIALKQAGLEARSVSPDQMKVVVERILPAELLARGVDDGNDICDAMRRGLAGLSGEGLGETPDAVFHRLGGGA